MKLSQQEREILLICVKELESTLSSMQAKDADVRVAVVAKILRGFIVEKEDN